MTTGELIQLKEKYRILTMVILLAITFFITYYFHFILRTYTVYTHLFYISIIISAMWWKRKGLFVTIFLAVMLILSSLFANNEIIADDVIRVIMLVVIGVVTVILSENISKREEKLRENENKFESIVTAAHNAIILMDNDGNITYWNDAAERIFGYSGQEVLNRELYSIIVPDKYHDAYRKGLAGFRTTGEGPVIGKTLELEAKRKDGTVFPVELSISALKLNGKWHSTGIVRDIKERKMADEKLLQVSLYSRGLIEASLDPLATISPEGKITDVNKATELVTGVPRENLTGRDFSDYFTEPEKAREGYQKVFEKGFVKDYPLAIRHVSGSTMDVLYNASVYNDAVGNVAGVFAAARDITERKRAEDELKKAYEELKKTQIQLIKSGKLAAMGELAAGIVHELTQPLLGISGFAAALLEDTNNFTAKSAIPEPDIRKFMEQSAADLDMIRQQTDRMTQLINRVRMFAHESGTGKEWNDINPRIENVLALFSQQLLDHNIRVVTNLASGLPRIFCNTNELAQVMINLITNARDAMDAKGKGGQLTITAGKSGSGIYIEVEDTGTGADTKAVSHMFEPSFTTKNGGMGLGLSIVHRIITDHEGTINVECRQGAGCKFTIRLPSGGIDKNG